MTVTLNGVNCWFTSTAFVRLIMSRHIKCHLIGMVKLGKTKFHTKWNGLLTTDLSLSYLKAYRTYAIR